MSLRLTTVCLRQPMIQFRYAIAKNGGKVAIPAAAGQQTIFESFDDLPANLRPPLMSEVEIETVLMGGAAPYVPKHLQKKKK